MLRSHRDHSRSLELCRPWSTTRRQCSRPVLAPSREYMLSASTRELMCLPSILLCSLLTSAFARQLRRVVFRPCEVSLASPKRDRSMWRWGAWRSIDCPNEVPGLASEDPHIRGPTCVSPTKTAPSLALPRRLTNLQWAGAGFSFLAADLLPLWHLVLSCTYPAPSEWSCNTSSTANVSLSAPAVCHQQQVSRHYSIDQVTGATRCNSVKVLNVLDRKRPSLFGLSVAWQLDICQTTHSCLLLDTTCNEPSTPRT